MLDIILLKTDLYIYFNGIARDFLILLNFYSILLNKKSRDFKGETPASDILK